MEKTLKEKYLVIADTYGGGFGVEYYLFGIFDTEKEAIDFVMENPTIEFRKKIITDYTGENIFSFFYEYNVDPNRWSSKEEFITRKYIKKFSGNPLYLGAYIE